MIHATAVRSARARVVVFPELSLTGYELDEPALRADDPRLEPLRKACADTGTLALAGAPLANSQGRPCIAMLAVEGSGIRVAYRKLYLSDTESQRFAPGDEPAVLELEGWRLGLAICKDMGQPEHAADTASRGMHAYVAGTAKGQEEVAQQDERARQIALEHRIWVAVASSAGSSAAGHSSIWSPTGELVARAGPEPGAIARATLSPA